MKLTEALGVIRNLPNANITARKTINLLSDQQLTQFKLLLRAKNILESTDVAFIDEAYGGLITKCYAPETADLNIIVLDSYSLGLSLLVRGEWKQKDDAHLDQGIDNYLSAIKTFCLAQKSATLIVPVSIRSAILNIIEPSQLTSNRLRWFGLLKELSALQREGNVFVLDGCDLDVDEMRFLDTGEFLMGEKLSSLIGRVSPTVDWIFRNRFPNGSGKEIKLLITDLDNTFWSGIIGDDGKENLHFQETDKGKRHWVYQKFLSYLHANGIIIAACSKNTGGVIEDAFRSLPFVFPSKCFSSVKVDWQPKSINCSAICEELNILPENVLFVDDNEIELNEVKLKLPSLQTLRFPDKKENFADFLQTLSSWFARVKPMTSVKERADSYQALQAFTLEKNASQGNDGKFSAYLASLQMELMVAKVNVGSKERCFELINKTNQFNLHGGRYTVEALETIKGSMFSVSLKDRATDHGIIAVIIIQDGTCEQIVLSCRVFSRFIEHAIMDLFKDKIGKIKLAKTEKNAPAMEFIGKYCGIQAHAGIEVYPVTVKPNSDFPGKVTLA